MNVLLISLFFIPKYEHNDNFTYVSRYIMVSVSGMIDLYWTVDVLKLTATDI